MMQRIEDVKPRLPRRIQDLQHMRHTTIRFRNSLQAISDLPNMAKTDSVG
jgi:hypothetical protein